MTSNDKPCVLVDSLVVLYNISYGQLGNLRWEGSAKHHQLTSGTSLVVRHRLSGHMPPNYGRASPGAALTGFGIPPSIITASRTQHYTSSYTNIYHTWYMSYIIFYNISYLCINRVFWNFSIITASWTLRYASHFCGIKFPTKKDLLWQKPRSIKTKFYDQLKLAMIFTNSHSIHTVTKTKFQGNVVFLFSKFHFKQEVHTRCTPKYEDHMNLFANDKQLFS